MSYNAGQKSSHWIEYCGRNHEYLQAPIEGWKGVEDGILAIGEERIEFTHWLEDVERDWASLGKKLHRPHIGESLSTEDVRSGFTKTVPPTLA